MGWFPALSFTAGLCTALCLGLEGKFPSSAFGGLAVWTFLCAIWEALELNLKRIK